jgi:pimeloyl-ACP methyl ester carboxylesterase
MLGLGIGSAIGCSNGSAIKVSAGANTASNAGSSSPVPGASAANGGGSGGSGAEATASVAEGMAGRAEAAAVSAGASAAGSGGAGAAAGDGGQAGGAAGTGGAAAGSGGQVGGAGAAAARSMQPIDAPVADDCIKDVSAGDHTFTCSGLTFLVMVDPMCTKYACGVIFDIHGATMSGAQMRDNTLLYKLAPSKGYIVVNPSATAQNTGGTWDLTNDPPKVADFLARTIKAYHVDPDRVHVGGFSQGSGMTFWFLCNRHELLASAAPISGASDVTCMNDSWQPRVPIFYENGTKDQASTIDRARTMVDSIVNQLKLTGGDMIAGDAAYRRKHWVGDGGMEFDYLEHDYGGQAVLDGHCIPGGIDKPNTGMNNFLGGINATTCTTGNITINWGELALQWYIDHPRKH